MPSGPCTEWRTVYIFRCNKLNAVLNGGEMLLDSDWIRLSNLLREDWIDHLTVSLALIGSTQKDSARLSGEANNPVNVEEVFKKTVKWLSATTNGIDNEDAKIVGRVSSFGFNASIAGRFEDK